MASRYPTANVLDYCFKPTRLVVDGEVIYTPCGKCDGCLLHKANEWSMRLGCEIEDCKFPIFFTLTYDNHFLPTCQYLGEHQVNLGVNYKVFTPFHDKNVRWNGKKDVPRVEPFGWSLHPPSFTGFVATNYQCDREYFAYTSKRDFQLYCKLIRNDLDETFPQISTEEKRFRYFAISEYGETLLRPHIHAVIFSECREISEYLLYIGLYKNWKMCRKDKFDEFKHYCDSGCRGYITQYLTSNSRLPSVYHEKSYKPWRLASKSPAIGFRSFSYYEIFENVITGNIEYYKDIKRLDSKSLLRYPKKIGSRLFPKCYEYRKYDFDRLVQLYGLLWCVKRDKTCYSQLYYDGLREVVNPATLFAQKVCANFCLRFGVHPHTFVYAVDMWYYKCDMYALRYWYQWQESKGNSLDVFRSYTNVYDKWRKWLCNQTSEYENRVFGDFMDGFNFNPYDTMFMESVDFSTPVDTDYVLEVEDIMSEMVKMPKFNEKFGFSPNSDCNF